MAVWTEEEISTIPKKYQCELIYTSATEEQIQDPKLPRDAYIVEYKVNKKTYVDVCRAGRRVDIFDLYYDKFGKGSIKLIKFGYGKSNPNVWDKSKLNKKNPK